MAGKCLYSRDVGFKARMRFCVQGYALSCRGVGVNVSFSVTSSCDALCCSQHVLC